MFAQSTAIGVDMHARSIRATALDTHTGEILEAKLLGRNDAFRICITGIMAGPAEIATTSSDLSAELVWT